MNIVESKLDVNNACYSQIIPAGEYWIQDLEQGMRLRITDLEGNQAADTFFFLRDDPEERYSALDTISRQQNVYLSAGSVLYSFSGIAMLEIHADTCGRHDTLGGACAAESNSVRYPLEKQFMHNCRDSFLAALQSYDEHLDKNILANNVNFFMNVPIGTDGTSSFADGISGPGKYVELSALEAVVAMISNCPQLNNPCNAYNPTPIQVDIWQPNR